MIEFDGSWLVHNDTSIRLRKAGYVCGVYTIDDNGKPLEKLEYSLHKWDEPTGGVKEVGRFDNPEDLNNIVKLLLSPEG